MVEKVMNKETRRIGKRTLAMFMAIVMCLSLLPVSAMASSSVVELTVGETVKLPGVAWSDNEKHEWYVEDESIVSAADGYVTGLKAGQTTVTHVYYEEIMEEIPAEETETPAEEAETPAEETEIPAEETETPAEEPEAPAEEPEAPAEEPEAPAEEPEAPAEEPEAPAEEPEDPAEETETPAEESEPIDLGTESLILNSPAEETEAPAEETETPAEESEAPAEETETLAEEAETPAEEPEAPAEEPEAPAEEPEAPAEEPEAPAEEPGVPAEEPAAPAEEPEAPAEEPEAPAEEPEAPAEELKEPVIVEIDGYERREESWTVVVTEPDGISGEATHEGVTVTVNAPYGAFPEGTELNIAPVEKEEPSLQEKVYDFFGKLFGNAAEMAQSAEEIEDPMEAVRSLLIETFEEIEAEANMVAFDITFTDPATGEELQPADGKTVDVQFAVAEDSALLANGPAALQVYHIHEEAVETIGEEVFVEAGEDAMLEVEAEMFSVYVLRASARIAAPAENVWVQIRHRNAADPDERANVVSKEQKIQINTDSANLIASLTKSWLEGYKASDNSDWAYYNTSLENSEISLMLEDGQKLWDPETDREIGTEENPIVLTLYYQAKKLVQEVTYFDYYVWKTSWKNSNRAYPFTGADGQTYYYVSAENNINKASNFDANDDGPKFAVGNNYDDNWHTYYNLSQCVFGSACSQNSEGNKKHDTNFWNTYHEHAFQGMMGNLSGDNYETVNFNYNDPGLFTPADGYGTGKKIYPNESLTFTRTGVDTYRFAQNDFFPLSDKKDAQINTSIRKGNDGKSLPYNEFFGMRLDAVFTVPEGYQGDLSYEFAGDDDVWVFIDGGLVLDMGGIHGAIDGRFTLNKNGTYSWVMHENHPVNGQPKRVSNVPLLDADGNVIDIDDGMPHTLTVLYMERGGNLSRCEMTIKLPNLLPQESVIVPEDTLETYTFTKTWSNLPEGVTAESIEAVVSDGTNSYPVTVTASSVTGLRNGTVSVNGNVWTITGKVAKSDADYSVTETAVNGLAFAAGSNRVDDKDGYWTKSGDNSDALINTHANDTTMYTVTKIWDDNDDAAGMRPDSITVKLLADGVDTGKTLVLNAANNWSSTFEELSQYTAAGQLINYTVDEAAVPAGYNKVSVEGGMANGFVITNQYIPEKTGVTVTKNWNDANDQDGKRPASVTVQLYANTVASGAPVILNADNQWTYTWTELAKYADGQLISYTVDETVIGSDLYTKESVTGNMAEGFVITNSYTPETTSASVRKSWEDANNQDGIRPAGIEVALSADGTIIGTAVLSQANGWSYNWTALPKYADGQLIDYTVDEMAVPAGYEKTSVTRSEGNSFVITNEHTPEVTSRTVTKVWNDADNQDGVRPAGIQVQLYANDVAVGNPVTLTNTLTYTWNNLPKFADGEEIAYSVDEVDVPEDYEKSVDGFVITNTHVPAEIEVSLEKIWDDNNDEGGIRPASITVQLYANGVASGDPVALSDDNNWRYTWTELPEFAAGQAISYTADEVSVPNGYEKTSVEGSMAEGYTITNTLQRGGFTVVKVDAANANSKLFGAEFTLTNDATGKTYTVASAANGEAEFENIPYGTYTLEETDAPANYVKSESKWSVIISADHVSIVEKTSAVQKLAAIFAASGKDFVIDGSVLTVENTHEVGTLTVEKDATPAGRISGDFTFTVYADAAGTQAVGTITVSANGSASAAMTLDTGVYYVKETSLADQVNYDHSATSYTVNGSAVTADANGLIPVPVTVGTNAAVVCTNEYTIKTGSLTVKKLVENTETDEAFVMTVKLGEGTVVAGGTGYVANGIYTFRLQHNETATITGIPYTTAYSVEEQYEEPFGYVVTYSNAVGSIAAAETVATVTNSSVTSGFVVNKIDKDSKAGLAGAEFTLYTVYDVADAANRVVYDTYTTGESGSVTISNLPAGIYWLKETDAPANYDITDDTVWKITVSASQTANTGADIRVEKDNTGKNFVATLYNTIVSFLGTKTYTVDPVTIQNTAADEEKTAVLTVENTKIDYSLTISKTVSGVDTNRTYKFNVYAATAAGEKGQLIAENIEVAAGASVTLSNKASGSEIPAANLVAGTYIVEENTSDVAVANYTWTGVEFDSHIAELTEVQRSDSVAAVNSYTRDMATLVVNKTFSGPADLAENFRIIVTAGNDSFAAGLADGVKNDDGSYSWSFPVKTNVRYDVSESNYDQVGNWSWISGTTTGSAIVTEKNGTASVALHNVYAHDQADLVISKEITGDLSETNVNRTFTFQVYKAGDRTTEIASVTLPENGSWSKTISVDNDTAYEVVESDGTVIGYIWSAAEQTVSVNVPVTGSATAAFVNNYEKDFGEDDEIYGDRFSIRKTDGTDPLAGAEFILSDGSNEIWSGTTDATGELTAIIDAADIADAKNTADKTYTLAEVAPEGYVGAGPWTVTLSCEKVESTTLKSGKFYHTYTWSVTSVTDAEGEQLGETGITVANDLIMGTITVNKTVTGLPETVANTNTYNFGVYNAEEELVDTLAISADSDWTGTTVSLPYGRYTIRETQPDDEIGYTWSGVTFDKQTVSIETQGQQIEVEAENAYTRDLGSLSVSKTVVIDELAAALVSDKEFELTIAGPADAHGAYGMGNETVTFENGVASIVLLDGESITIENLPTGTYTVTESDSAEAAGLVLTVTGSANGGDAVVADEGIRVSVEKNETADVAVMNTYDLGSDRDTARFYVSKKNGDTNAAISGVTFTLYADKACTQAVAGMSKVTDENGKAEFVLGDELLNGESVSFFLKETVPAGYVDNGTVWEIKVDKADADGSYEVTLAQVPEGLFHKLYHWFVTIINESAVWSENTLVIANEPIDYTIRVVKVDEDGAALAGSAFALNGSDMEAISGTDNQFSASVNYTVTPELTISETTVPTGYTGVADFGLEFVVENGVVTDLIETEDSEAVIIEKNGDIYTIVVENVRRPDGPEATDDTAEFTICKVESGKIENGLSGAEFALLSADEYAKYESGEVYEALRTVTSDETGLAEIDRLVTVNDEAESTYYLIETSAPTGFTADSSVWAVTVTKTANAPVYEGTADEGQWIVHKSYAVTDIQLNGESVLAEGMVEITNTRNSYMVTVTKSFSGRAALPENFRIVNSCNDTVFTVSNAVSGNGIDAPYTWTMEIPFGTEVAFTEENYDDEADSGYSVVAVTVDNSGAAADGAVVIPANNETAVDFTNTYEMVFDPANDDINGTGFSISKTGDYEDGFLSGAQFALTDENGAVVWTGVTADGLLDVIIESGDIVDPKAINAEGETIRTYTLTETAPAGYTGAGPWTVTISGKARISEDLKENKFYHIYDWTVASVTLAGETENLLADGIVSILNTRDYGTLTITKTVKGLVGAEAKAEHIFGIRVTNGAEIANTYDVTVTGNGTASYAETVTLPTGAYSVKELEALINEHSEPAVSWKVNGESALAEDGEISIEIGKDTETAVEVTNEYSYDPARHTVSVNVTKVWEDDNDRDRIRPDSIRVELKDAEGTVIGTKDIGADGVATFEFDPYFNEYKEDYVVTEIGYTVDGQYIEGEIPGYTASVDGYTVTNTHVVETVDIAIEKIWKDKSNESIVVRLLADGAEIRIVTMDGEIDKSETEAWVVVLEDLPVNNAGEPIDYTVTEDSFHPGWDHDITKIEEDGSIRFQVVNFRIPADDEEEEEDESVVVIPDDDIPTADIFEEEIPTAAPPKTGDTMIVWILAAVASGLGLVWLALDGKKRKEEKSV